MPRRAYIFRLYSTHDSDLIFYAFTHDVDLVVALYVALNAYIRGERFKLDAPPSDKPIPTSLRRRYSLQLRLNENKDSQLIQLLDSIQSGYRNIFFRNILRLYLSVPIHPHQLNNSGDKTVFNDLNSALEKKSKLVMLNPSSNRFKEKARIIDGNSDVEPSKKKRIKSARAYKRDNNPTELLATAEPIVNPSAVSAESATANTEVLIDHNVKNVVEIPDPLPEETQEATSQGDTLTDGSFDSSLFDDLLDMLGQ